MVGIHPYIVNPERLMSSVMNEQPYVRTLYVVITLTLRWHL